jgi:hypothetical protein
MREYNVEIKGTWAYGAARLSKNRALRAGMEIKLRRDPDNENDHNAVAVYRNRTKLGFLPREVAYEVANYLESGGSYSASITSSRQTKSFNGKKYPLIFADLIFHDLMGNSSYSDEWVKWAAQEEKRAREEREKANRNQIQNEAASRPSVANNTPPAKIDFSSKIFSLICPLCMSVLEANEDLKDVKIKCGACNETFVYRYRVTCPLCQAQIEIKKASVNDQIRCKGCNGVFRLTP